jgi:hypothetical protein
LYWVLYHWEIQCSSCVSRSYHGNQFGVQKIHNLACGWEDANCDVGLKNWWHASVINGIDDTPISITKPCGPYYEDYFFHKIGD